MSSMSASMTASPVPPAAGESCWQREGRGGLLACLHDNWATGPNPAGPIPGPAGRSTLRNVAIRAVTTIRVIPRRGAGRFSLRPSHFPPPFPPEFASCPAANSL